jgi:hypothetical protein
MANNTNIISQQELLTLLQGYDACRYGKVPEITSSEEFKSACSFLKESGASEHDNLGDMLRTIFASPQHKELNKISLWLDETLLECKQMVYVTAYDPNGEPYKTFREDIQNECWGKEHREYCLELLEGNSFGIALFNHCPGVNIIYAGNLSGINASVDTPDGE